MNEQGPKAPGALDSPEVCRRNLILDPNNQFATKTAFAAAIGSTVFTSQNRTRCQVLYKRFWLTAEHSRLPHHGLKIASCSPGDETMPSADGDVFVYLGIYLGLHNLLNQRLIIHSIFLLLQRALCKFKYQCWWHIEYLGILTRYPETLLEFDNGCSCSGLVGCFVLNTQQSLFRTGQEAPQSLVRHSSL